MLSTPLSCRFFSIFSCLHLWTFQNISHFASKLILQTWTIKSHRLSDSHIWQLLKFVEASESTASWALVVISTQQSYQYLGRFLPLSPLAS